MSFEEFNINDKEIADIFSNHTNPMGVIHKGYYAHCSECGELLYICKECNFRGCKNKKCKKFLRCSKYKKEDTTEVFQYGMEYRDY